MTNSINKSDLQQIAKMIDGWRLKPSRMLMTEKDYLDLSEQKRCSECGGLYSNKLTVHPQDDCDLQKVFGIMES
jgi:hypothetical protein